MGRIVKNPGKWESYYNGEHRLDAIGVSLPPDVRVLEMQVGWPKLAVDVLVESLVLDGFSISRHGGQDEAPEQLNRILQANNFRTKLTLALTEALVSGAAFMVVGGGSDPSIPHISVHKGGEFELRRDATGRLVQATQTYRDGLDTYRAVYEPGVTRFFALRDGFEVLTHIDEHGFDGIPVIPFVNQIRLGEEGRSEIEEIHKLCDAAARTLTNLQVAQELLSMPVRYLFGDGVEEMFLDEDGTPQQSRLEAYFGRFLVGPSGAQTGSVPGADLTQLLNTFKTYALQVASQTGIPPFMLGVSTESNPASAEAMRSAKDRLITKAELKQSIFGDAVEDLARCVLAVAGVDTEGLETLEARWRDPAVISLSSRNALMLQAQAQGVVSSETVREFMGLSPEQLKRDRALDRRLAVSVGDPVY